MLPAPKEPVPVATRFPAASEGVDREMLFNFHLAAYDRARSERAAFWEHPTLPRWRSERRRLEKIFRGMFDPFPEKCDLAPRIASSFERDGYCVENVSYQSVPGIRITANLYLPDKLFGQAPGILLACGHAANGKAYQRYQLMAIALARRGMIVLCFDPVSQGERCQLWDHVRRRALAAFEHNVLDRPAVLAGGSVAGIFVLDAMRSIDYLLTRDEIDPARIGMAGNSGGGTQTTWTVSVDKRIAAAAPMCFVTSVRERLLSREPADAEQNPADMLKHGLEYADFLAMLAPKPLLICAARGDFFPIKGARDTVAALRKLWELTGGGGKVDIFEAPGGHGLSDEIRRAACDWFCRWFGLPVPDVERPAQPEPDKNLWVTRSGQVAEDESAGNYFSMAADAIARRRPGAGIGPRRLRRLLGLPAAGRRAGWPQAAAAGESDGIATVCYRLESEPGITVPCVLFEPKPAAASGALVVYSHEDGFEAQTGPRGMVMRLALAGHAVLAFDPRGVGLTRGGAFGWWANSTKPHLDAMRASGALPDSALGYNDPAYEGPYCTEFEHAETAMMLGRPLLGGRAFDTLRALDAAASLPGASGRPIVLVGAGAAALWSLYAAALARRKPAGLVLHAPPASYRLLALEPRAAWHQNILARGLLPDADCPEVLRLLSPAPVLLLDPADALRLPLSRAAAGRLFGRPRPRGLRMAWTDHVRHPAETIIAFLRSPAIRRESDRRR